MTMMTTLVIINLVMLTIIYSDKLMLMGASLLISATIITLSITLMNNSWYAFILFLIYVTGLLVLFGYFLAMSPNVYQMEKHYFKYFLILALSSMIIPKKMTGMPQFMMNFEKDVMNIISKNNLPVYWMMTIVLLLTLLMVVSMTYKSPSPLRKFL